MGTIYDIWSACGMFGKAVFASAEKTMMGTVLSGRSLMVVQKCQGLVEVEGDDAFLNGIQGGEFDGVFLDGKAVGCLLNVL